MLLLRPSNQRPWTGSHSLDAAAYRIEPAVHEYKVRWGLHGAVYYSGFVSYNSQKWHSCLLFQTASSTLVRLPFMLPRLNYRAERKTPLLALRQSGVDLMTFQTRTSQELDFLLIATSKNNLSEVRISRPTPYVSLFVLLFPLYCCICPPEGVSPFACNLLDVLSCFP